MDERNRASEVCALLHHFVPVDVPRIKEALNIKLHTLCSLIFNEKLFTILWAAVHFLFCVKFLVCCYLANEFFFSQPANQSANVYVVFSSFTVFRYITNTYVHMEILRRASFKPSSLAFVWLDCGASHFLQFKIVLNTQISCTVYIKCFKQHRYK